MSPSCHVLNVNLHRHVYILCVHLESELLRCGAKQTRVFVFVPVFVFVFVFLFVSVF